jgi:hypothetical protein
MIKGAKVIRIIGLFAIVAKIDASPAVKIPAKVRGLGGKHKIHTDEP